MLQLAGHPINNPSRELLEKIRTDESLRDIAQIIVEKG